jgi:hypothetical protein
MARPVKQGAGRRFLGGLPLLWQWLLVFVLTIVVLVGVGSIVRRLLQAATQLC